MQWEYFVRPELRKDWKRWQQKLKGAEDLHMLSCIKPRMFGKIAKNSVYHFSDASEKGYGQCSYIPLINDEGAIHCSYLVWQI